MNAAETRRDQLVRDVRDGTLTEDAEIPLDTRRALRPHLTESMEKARAKLTEENDAKQQAYEEKLEAGRARARELTDRFADWYYVISDSVYENVRLTRADIVEKTGEPGSEGN